MKVNVILDLSAEKIVALTDQLPQKEFSRMKKMIESKASNRFRAAMVNARKEFRKAKLRRKDAENAVAEVRGKTK